MPAEPLEVTTLQRRDREARQAFAKDVDALLEAFAAVVGRDTLREVRSILLTRFQQSQALPHVDPLGLQQLLCEAYDLLTNPESQIDLRDWKRAAAPFVLTTFEQGRS